MPRVRHPALYAFPTRRSSDLWTNQRGAVVSSLFTLNRRLERESLVGARPVVRRWCEHDELNYCTPSVWEVAERTKDAQQMACSRDRKSTRLNSSHQIISYAVF